MSLISLVENKNIDGTINKQNKYGDTDLIIASRNEHIEIIKLLLNVETINVNLQNNYKNTALHWASKKNYIEIIKLLLEHKTINVNIQNNYENTALICASNSKNIEVVKLLLNVEMINVNLQNNSKNTALICASDKGNIEIIKLLLSKGASTISVNSNYSKDINDVLTNWKTYLPRWNRFKTYRYYPKEFKEIAIQWLLICKRKNFVSKDIRLLMIEYFAESWKLN